MLAGVRPDENGLRGRAVLTRDDDRLDVDAMAQIEHIAGL